MVTAAPRARRVHPRTAVLPRHGRRHNLSLVLQTLYTVGPMSRADLARRLDLTKVTVSDLVAELLESALVLEVLEEAGGRGDEAAVLLVGRQQGEDEGEGAHGGGESTRSVSRARG